MPLMHADRRARSRSVACFGLAFLFLGACNDLGDDGRESIVIPKSFGPPTNLNSTQITEIVRATATATDAPRLTIAVVDRIGNVLRLYQRGISSTLGGNPVITDIFPEEDRAPLNFATSIARGAAFLSHSQAPLTSRTGQFLNTFHFPAVFDASDYLTMPPFAFPSNLPVHNGTIPIQRAVGVMNTPQAPLWQIDASNRGTTFESAATLPPTMYVGGQAIGVLTNPDGSTPSPGIGPLPGGVPLYLRSAMDGDVDVPRRLVGAVAVYITDAGGAPQPELAEFAAFTGSLAPNPTPFMGNPEDFTFGPIPNEGAVFLVGILLPYLFQTVPRGANLLGSYDPLDEVSPLTAADMIDGQVDPVGFLFPPQDSNNPDGLTAAEVTTILDRCRDASRATHAAIRLPADSPCKMIFAVCDRDGVIQGVFREEDATLFSFEISITKARNAAFFSDPNSRWSTDVTEAGVLAGMHPLTGFRPRRDANGGFLPLVDADGNLLSANGDIVDIFPPSTLVGTGVAVTARTLGFLTQPFYPPGIDSAAQAGPLHVLVQKNRTPTSFQGQGFAARFGSGDPNEPVYPDTQSGIIFFPGSAPLYRDGVLVGGIGVSGDGVEQDDIVTDLGIRMAQQELGFVLEPPADIRADRFAFDGVRVPYFKFPQNPGG